MGIKEDLENLLDLRAKKKSAHQRLLELLINAEDGAVQNDMYCAQWDRAIHYRLGVQPHTVHNSCNRLMTESRVYARCNSQTYSLKFSLSAMGKRVEVSRVPYLQTNLDSHIKTLTSSRDALADPDTPPLSVWLFDRILQRCAAASQGLVKGSEIVGVNAYKMKVFQYLNPVDPELLVLALCARKGFGVEEEEKYYEKFFGFASEASQQDKTSSARVRVCRLFLCNGSGVFEEGRINMIKLHNAHQRDGVCALSLVGAARMAMQGQCTGLPEMMDAGFGYLLFMGSNGTTAITHYMAGNELRANVWDAPELVVPLVAFFRWLVSNSAEKNPSAESDPDKVLTRLIEDLEKRLISPRMHVKPWPPASNGRSK